MEENDRVVKSTNSVDDKEDEVEYREHRGRDIPQLHSTDDILVRTLATILIKQQTYGYFVEVGCATFAIETKETLIRVLSEYINAPSETEKKFKEGKLF